MDKTSKVQNYQRVLIFLMILLPALSMFVIRLASEGSSYFDLFIS